MKVHGKLTLLILLSGSLILTMILKAEKSSTPLAPFDHTVNANAKELVADGRQIFRFDAFGDEDFWGGTLHLHKAVEGARLGGVGPGLSPATAAAVGLRIDVDALPEPIVSAIKAGQMNLNEPAVTLALLKLNAVVGISGVFNADGTLKTMGIQCALCHSRVDNSFSAPGIPEGVIGHRLDGWSNQDLNIGQIVALAPNLEPVAKLLRTDVATVKKVLMSWGPGKFDAELFLDGKAFQPNGRSAATLIPPAFGKAGVNLHTWTGDWGTVSYWNAFVANLEMHGKGNFFDPRLDNAAQFPIAAANGAVQRAMFGQMARDFGKQHAIEELVDDYVDGDELNALGWELTAVCTRVSNAIGAYRPGRDEGGALFLLYRTVSWVS